MNFTELETKLKTKVIEAEPSLDITGADKKVLHIIQQDLRNYIKFLSKPAKPENPDCPNSIEQILQEASEEIDSFLTVWTGLWLKKWKERFNLLINPKTNPVVGKAAERAEKMEECWFQFASRYELSEIVVLELIRNAEICGTAIIAENIIKTELGKQKTQDLNSKASSIALIRSVLQRVRELSQKTGPLVSIKIDKNYYCQVNA
jgi:hypothetical protein